MFYFNSIDRNLWMNRQRAVYVRWPLYTSTFAVRWWVYLHWVTIRWNWVQFSGSFRALDLYYPHASNVIYIVFHNKKNPSTLYVFLVLKNILPIPNIFLVRKKSNDMCLQNYQHSLTLYERMCTGDVQKCKITTFEYWLIIQHYDKQNFAKRTCMLNLIHYRYTYLVMSSCLFSFVIFKGCFWMKYLVFRSFGIYIVTNMGCF